MDCFRAPIDEHRADQPASPIRRCRFGRLGRCAGLLLALAALPALAQSARDGALPAQPRGDGGLAAPPPQQSAQAQAAILYEENADNTPGAESFRGQVTWRVDMENGPQGPERILRGRVEFRERGVRALVTIRRNLDQALPASHTIELLFDLSPSFPHGPVESVAGVRMKPSEQARGRPLVGAVARLTAGSFLAGLTVIERDRERNIAALRDWPWMDLPIVFRNGRRAVIALDKGASGEQAFAEASAHWGQDARPPAASVSP